MVSESQKTEIKRRAADGESVNEIKADMALPKSTVYYHFRKEVGQKQKENALEIPEDSEVRGELCGVFAGDGSFYKDDNYHYSVRIHLNQSDDYWRSLSEFLSKVLEKEPLQRHEEDTLRTRLKYDSKRLHQFFNNHLEYDHSDKCGTVNLPSIEERSTEFLIGFIRGLIDTDGFLDTELNRVRFNTVSEDLACSVEDILDPYGMKYRTRVNKDHRENCRDVYRTIVSSEDTERLLDKVQPRNSKKSLEALNWSESS